MLIGKDTKMPDLLVLLATLGGLMFFGAPGILIGPIIGALFLAAWQMWGGAIDEARNTPEEERAEEAEVEATALAERFKHHETCQ
jgi:predicted PurR-regulated permease PerM